jgi:trigger factor
LKVESNSITDCKKEIWVEVAAEDLKGDYSSVCNKYRRNARVPGFRPGKAPLAVIMVRYKDAIREDFLETAIQKYFAEAIRDENLSPLHPPHFHEISYTEGEPLRFKAVFEVLPKLDISDYKGLEIDKISPEVKEEEVEETLKEMRERMAEYLPADDRPVESGDIAVISYSGKFSDGSQPGLEAKDVYYEVSAPNTLPEFNENLIGARVGDAKSFRVKYSQEFPNKSLAGKEVEYAVELQSIKIKKIPELNDDFAKDVGQFTSLEELRSKIRSDLTARKELVARSQMQEKLLDLVIEKNPFEVPEIMVKKQAENRLKDYIQSLIMQGVHPQTLDINWAELQERQKERAVHDVKAALVLEHIADQEKITVSEEEVNEEISKRAQEARQSFEAAKSRLTKDGGKDRITTRIRNRKSLDLLLSLATFKNPQGIIIQP